MINKISFTLVKLRTYKSQKSKKRKRDLDHRFISALKETINFPSEIVLATGLYPHFSDSINQCYVPFSLSLGLEILSRYFTVPVLVVLSVYLDRQWVVLTSFMSEIIR